MTRKLASKWCRTILAATILGGLPAYSAAEFGTTFDPPIAPTDLPIEVFPRNVFSAAELTPPTNSVQSIDFDPGTFIFTDVVKNAVPLLDEDSFTLDHNFASAYPSGITPRYSITWRKNGAVVAVGDSANRNWMSITPSATGTRTLQPGESQEYIVTYEGASTPVSSLEPGIYSATVTFTTTIAGGDEVKLGDFLIGLGVDDSVTGYIYDLGSFSNVGVPQMYLRVLSEDIGNFNAFMQFVPVQGEIQTIALFHGNGPGRENFAQAAGANQDMAVLLADDSPGIDVSAAYDRSIPAVTGRWRPAQLNTFIQTDTDATVAAAIDDSIRSGLASFTNLTAGSYRLVLYADNDTPNFQLVEVSMLPDATIEGDLDPRGRTPGAPEILRVLNVISVFISSFHLLGFEHMDMRLTAPAISGVPSLVQPTSFTIGGQANSALAVNVSSPLDRGFDPISANPIENYAFSARGGYGLEFSKMDVAPESSRGDGLITVADLVQLALYTAGAGFPTPSAQNGPLSPGDRVVYLGQRDARLSITRGTTDANLPEIPIKLRTRGVEQNVSLGIEYDTNLLEFVSARRNGRSLDVPTFEIQNDSLAGVVGIEIGLRPNRTYPVTLEDGSQQDPSSYLIEPSNGTDFRTGDGFNEDVIVGYVKFRPKEGTGTVNTELRVTQPGESNPPLNGREPSVTLPSGAGVSSFFISSGVTIVGQGAQSTRVRVDDTVLAQGDGSRNTIDSPVKSIDIVMDATGLENATGFELTFDPTKIDILGVRPGVGVPGSAFFLANPDFDPTAPTNTQRINYAARADEAGRIRLVVALQPGTTFPAGRNVIATLDVEPRSLEGTGLDQDLVAFNFAPLGDTLEVVGADAIPVSSSFGKTGTRTDTVTVVSSACSYDVSFAFDGATTGTLRTYPLTGGTGRVTVNPSADQCSWTASVDYDTAGQRDWVRFPAFPGGVASDIGPRNLDFEVLPFSGAGTRVARIRVTGQDLEIRQTGCGVSVELVGGVGPREAAFAGLGGNGEININAFADNCQWSISSSVSWITFDKTSGTGSDSVVFTVAANRGEARVGEILVGGETILVRQDFTFASSSEGWTLFTGSLGPGFTTADGSYNRNSGENDGRLQLVTANNTDTFGYWQSPMFNITNSESLLYRAIFRVSTNTSKANAPVFRVRASTGDFSQTAEFTVESATGVNPSAPVSPDTTGRAYEHYFQVPVAQNQLRLYFDVLNFTTLDEPVSRLNLESMAITSLDRTTELLDRRVELAGLVASTADFTEISIRPYPLTEDQVSMPVFLQDTRGASVGAGDVDPVVAKTSVGILSVPTGVAVSSNRLYEVVFQVSARSQTTTTIRKEKVPAFRMRVNESSLQLTSLLNIESIDENSVVPTFQQNVRYSVWLPSNIDLSGRTLSVALDYIFTADSLNDPSIAVVLEKVEIYSYARPN